MTKEQGGEPVGLHHRIGANVEGLREGRGLSRADLARLIDQSEAAVAAIEAGERALRIDDLARLAWALQCTATELFRAPRSRSKIVSRDKE